LIERPMFVPSLYFTGIVIPIIPAGGSVVQILGVRIG